MTNNSADLPIEEPPAARIAHAVNALGEDEVVSRSVALLAGYNVGDEFLLYVGGVHAQGILDGAPPLYWPEVWGARALLHVWNDSARMAVQAGLGNQAWRVREMSARVAALRKLPFVAEVTELATDDNARVRAQAARTLGEIADADSIPTLNALLKDKEIEVRRQAGPALKVLRARSPRPAEDAVSVANADASIAAASTDDAAEAVQGAEATEATEATE